MAGFRLDSEKISMMVLGAAGCLIVSFTGGMALAQFAIAGIDPQLADTYRHYQTEQVAAADHDLMGRMAPVSEASEPGLIGDDTRPQVIAFRQDDAFQQEDASIR